MKEAVVSRIRPVLLRDQVIREIQQAILEHRLRPGDRIREQDLADQMGISRMPVREAFLLLERDGLVIIEPNRGCFVRWFDEQDIREIFTMRLALETLAAQLVVDRLSEADVAHLEALIRRQELAISERDEARLARLDREFHRYIVKCADHARLSRAWEAIAVQYTAAYSYRGSSYFSDAEQDTISDHAAIADALRHGDVSRFTAISSEITSRSIRQCLQALPGRDDGPIQEDAAEDLVVAPGA